MFGACPIKALPSNSRSIAAFQAIMTEPLAKDGLIRLYKSEDKIYARSIQGRYARLRWLNVWVTQLVFYLTPWLTWGGRQVVLFDLEARRFYIFGLVLYPQDFIYLATLLIICALSLFLVTAVAGRVWCGYGCPQTVYTEIFMAIERFVEGDRHKRQRLDCEPWSIQKLGRKAGKHGLWVVLALWTGLTFVGYFTPVRELASSAVAFSLGPWQTFWMLFYAFATYGNAGFMREQVCKYMCPYARFQSAMFDKDTLIVTYDQARGEPRGARGRGVDTKNAGLGDCIDCSLCVQVCPTGIDIRNGLQYECIGCAACVDACNIVMDKLHYPQGLVRYSTQQAMAQKWSPQQVLQRLRRPRILVYSSIWLVICSLWLTSLAMRQPYKVDVVRDRGTLARLLPGGVLENVYRVQIMNAAGSKQTFSFAAEGLQGLKIASETKIEVAAAQSRWLVLRLDIPYGSQSTGSHPIQLKIQSDLDDRPLIEKTVFYVPR
jgi:cytochrome c oxidase accessory protein FixG